MSLHLKSFMVSPPGSWRFTQKESGLTISSVTFFDLVRKVAQHRYNNNYPTIGNIAEEIENDICQHMVPEDQANYCEIGVRSQKSIHWSEVQRFLTDLVGWIKVGFKPVEQEEAERRAAICKTCPMNIGMHGCGTCRQTLDGIRETVMKLSTSKDADLRACGVCGCELKTAVFVPIAVLNKGQKDLVFPKWCWQAKDSENYRT